MIQSQLTDQAIQDLENRVRDIIIDTYKKQFTGIVKVKKLSNGYQVQLYQTKEIPLLDVSADIENLDDFFKYFKEELRKSRLHFVEYYKGYKYEKIPNMA